MNLIIILLIVLNSFYFPLPQNVLGCAGVETSNILGVPVSMDTVNSIPDNTVERYFDVGDNGQVWILSQGYVLVFDTSINDLTQENAHPCGVYAFLSPTDKDLLIDEYAPQYCYENYDSWQEYWYAREAGECDEVDIN